MKTCAASTNSNNNNNNNVYHDGVTLCRYITYGQVRINVDSKIYIQVHNRPNTRA